MKDISLKIQDIENRSKIENYIRLLLINDNYTEVKTPIINRFADIAPIKQFVVSSPLEQTEFYLRIAPTEQLKKLIYCGFERVFEFSTNFRNDKTDRTHLFEFNSLEIIDKNCTVFDKMKQVERIIKSCMVYCKQEIRENIGEEFCNCSSKKWPRIDIIQFFFNEFHIDIRFNDCLERLKEIYQDIYNKKCIDTNKKDIICKIIEYLARKYDSPVFIGNYPWEIEGPAKLGSDNIGKERYELFYKEIEIANMSSTLTNPVQLLNWYSDNIDKKNKIENKDYKLDPELIYIFERNMPKSAIVGIGIERLIMLLLGKEKISDVVCFSDI